MDVWTRDVAANLRKMSSERAAEWLLENYGRDSPDFGIGIKLLSHVSLRKKEDWRLAVHYLAGTTFANSGPYEIFAKRLGIVGLVAVLEEVFPTTDRDRSLLNYHLGCLSPLATSERDKAELQRLRDRLAGS